MSNQAIHILPEQVASQIAAGEVVERPASAVKELIENSIDAGAHRIEIELEKGGSELIAVADDGCGMGPRDAVLALRRHATSKIMTADDLVSIRTLGFRGEALAAIASVSILELKTRRAEDLEGVHLSIHGGELVESRTCALAAGTRVEARRLFFNTPARLKFLKTTTTEQSAATEVVQRLALAKPGLAMSLVADNRTLLDLPRAPGLRDRIRQLYGIKLTSRVLPFGLEQDALRVNGFASVTQESYPSPRMIVTFVNGRAVRDKLLMRAVNQAYANLLPRGRYPAVILFLTLPCAEVDVNVHPMKAEVRFRHGDAVLGIVYRALRERLADQTSPDASASAVLSESGSPAEFRANAYEESLKPSRQQLPEYEADKTIGNPEVETSLPGMEGRLKLVVEVSKTLAGQHAPNPGYSGQSAIANHLESPALQIRTPAALAPAYSQLKLLGQVFSGYITLEGEAGLILVDQHAAHERVTFEKLRGELERGAVRVQPLLISEQIELNPSRAAAAEGAMAELRALGFDIEPFGSNTLVLKGAPAVFGLKSGTKLLSDMIDSIGETGLGRRGEAAFDGLLKTLACHGSIRAGRLLAPQEMRELLAELDRTRFKTTCPHGRPVHIEFGRNQIERMFRR